MLSAMRRHPRASISVIVIVVVVGVIASLAYMVTPTYLGALFRP